MSRPYTLSHPNPKHVMVIYRKFILGEKRTRGTARGQIHYRDYIEGYLEAKAKYIADSGLDTSYVWKRLTPPEQLALF